MFRVHLVLRTIDVTDVVLRREELVLGFLTAHVALILHVEEWAATAETHLTRMRDLLFERVVELLALQEARRIVGEKYLAGHPALFPATTRHWDEQVHQCQEMVVMALRLAELEGAEPIDEERQLLPDPKRIEACIGDLVEVARIKTLDDMGEGPAAIERTRRWLSEKLN